MDGKWSPSRGNFAANADRSRPHQICGRRLSTSMRFQPSGLARSIGKNQTPVHHRLRNIRKARSRELQDPSKWYAKARPNAARPLRRPVQACRCPPPRRIAGRSPKGGALSIQSSAIMIGSLPLSEGIRSRILGVRSSNLFGQANVTASRCRSASLAAAKSLCDRKIKVASRVAEG